MSSLSPVKLPDSVAFPFLVVVSAETMHNVLTCGNANTVVRYVKFKNV